MATSDKLVGRVALITGAGGGIGQAIARRFAAEKCAVLCVDIVDQSVELLVAELEDNGDTARSLVADIATSAGALAACRTAIETFGHIDILINNAVHFPPEAPITELASDEFNLTMAINVGGAVEMCRQVLPHMRRQGGGVIVNVASQLGSVGKKGQAYYCASKGALIALTRAMALDHAEENIRVVSLSPGGVATSGMADKWGDMATAERDWGRAKHPLGRLARVEEIAGAALFLACDDASFITGTDLIVDGGYTAQ